MSKLGKQTRTNKKNETQKDPTNSTREAKQA
jgi:hypothetical protein